MNWLFLFIFITTATRRPLNIVLDKVGGLIVKNIENLWFIIPFTHFFMYHLNMSSHVKTTEPGQMSDSQYLHIIRPVRSFFIPLELWLHFCVQHQRKESLWNCNFLQPVHLICWSLHSSFSLLCGPSQRHWIEAAGICSCNCCQCFNAVIAMLSTLCYCLLRLSHIKYY